MTTYEEKQKEIMDSVSNKETKTVLKFGAEWCPPCQQVKPIIQQLSEDENNIDILDIDVDKFPELAWYFHIMNIPTLAVLKDSFDFSNKDFAQVLNIAGMTPEQMKEEILSR